MVAMEMGNSRSGQWTGLFHHEYVALKHQGISQLSVALQIDLPGSTMMLLVPL
jgi:hypothetical protein